MADRRCRGCGALVPDVAGPVHPYVPSAPGCWRVFGEVQADERSRQSTVQSVAVDAYMAQHPGDASDRRDRQSVVVHLVGLCAVLERGFPPERAVDLLGRVASGRREFPALERASAGDLTVLHIVGARDLRDYERRVDAWASAVWAAWRDQHLLIRSLLDSLL